MKGDALDNVNFQGAEPNDMRTPAFLASCLFDSEWHSDKSLFSSLVGKNINSNFMWYLYVQNCEQNQIHVVQILILSKKVSITCRF